MHKSNTATPLSRRAFLTGLLALPWMEAGAKNSIFTDHLKTISDPIFINGHHDQAGQFYVSGMTQQGAETFRTPLPEMPHGFAKHPHKPEQLVSFPGLTGEKTIVLDVKTGQQIAQIKARKNRHFNGHGAFSPDGKWLYATENVIDTSAGVIGIYDAHTFEFSREISAHGLGPHGMRALPDGKTLVVASGGLKTDPKTGKFYSNLNNMHSAVIFIDIASGKLIARREIPVARLSIRNIYFADNNQLLVTCQYWGKRDMPKVVGLIQDMGEIEMLDIDEDNLWLMRNYTGGTVISGNTAAVSCPRGNRLTFWDLQAKKFTGSVEITDVSGVQPMGDGQHFLASAETGKLYQIDAKNLSVTPLSPIWKQAKWTNHMVQVRV